MVRAERALRARFLDADVEGKGSLTKPQLEEALRGLNVLRANAPKPGSFYKREVGVLEKIGLLFDFGDGLLSYRSFERLLLKVFRNEVRGSSNRRRQAAGGDGDGSPFSDTSDGRGGGGGEEDDGDDDEGLELLPPDVYDALVAELVELHAVNKHACATGAGPRKSVRAEAVAEKLKEHTFTPKINQKSRQLERHALAAASQSSFATDTASVLSGADETLSYPGGEEEETPQGQSTDRFSRLYEAAHESLARKEEYAAVMKEERLDEEGCTFWPMLSEGPRRPRRRRGSLLDDTLMTDDGESSSIRGDHLGDDLRGEEDLLEEEADEYLEEVRRSAPVRLSRAELLAMEESTAARREAEELAEATFHPMINPPLRRRGERKRTLFLFLGKDQFLTRNDHFTKTTRNDHFTNTGSDQTRGKHSKQGGVFLQVGQHRTHRALRVASVAAA